MKQKKKKQRSSITFEQEEKEDQGLLNIKDFEERIKRDSLQVSNFKQKRFFDIDLENAPKRKSIDKFREKFKNYKIRNSLGNKEREDKEMKKSDHLKKKRYSEVFKDSVMQKNKQSENQLSISKNISEEKDKNLERSQKMLNYFDKTREMEEGKNNEVRIDNPVLPENILLYKND